MVDLNIGYELEVGLNTRMSKEARKTARELGFSIGEDGSVDCWKNNSDEVEFKSPVYRKSNQKKKKRLLFFDVKQPLVDDKLFDDFKQIACYINEINHSMGLHVHLSFANKEHYKYLFSYDFVKLFQEAYKKKFTKKKERKRMDNDYCKFYDDGYEFLDIFREATSTKCKVARGFSVNFNAYPVHHTIEFRIFPSTSDVEEFKKYVLFLVNFVSDYISSMAKLKEAYVVK